MKKSLSFLCIFNFLAPTIYGYQSQIPHNKEPLSVSFDPKNRFRSADKIKKKKSKKQKNIALGLLLYVLSVTTIGGLTYAGRNIDVESEFDSLLLRYIEYDKITKISTELKDYLVEQMEQVKKALNKDNIHISEDILFPLSLLKIFNLYSVFESMEKSNIENFIFKLESSDWKTNKIDFYISSDENTYGKESRSRNDRFDSNHKFQKSWYAEIFDRKTKDFCNLVDNRFWTNFKSCKFTEELLKLLGKFSFEFNVKRYENDFSFSCEKNNDSIFFNLSNKLVI